MSASTPATQIFSNCQLRFPASETVKKRCPGGAVAWGGDGAACRGNGHPPYIFCSLREPMRFIGRLIGRNRVRLLFRFGPRITYQQEVLHENALGCPTRSRDTCHGPFMDGYACVRARRVRSEPPSRSVGWLSLGWSKSSLVPETHRSCRGLWSSRDAVVLAQVSQKVGLVRG
jgi:hypothetical protein